MIACDITPDDLQTTGKNSLLNVNKPVAIADDAGRMSVLMTSKS